MALLKWIGSDFPGPSPFDKTNGVAIARTRTWSPTTSSDGSGSDKRTTRVFREQWFILICSTHSPHRICSIEGRFFVGFLPVCVGMWVCLSLGDPVFAF